MLASQADNAKSKIGNMVVVGVFVKVVNVANIKKRTNMMPSRQIKIDIK